jgi:hypothetical protein
MAEVLMGALFSMVSLLNYIARTVDTEENPVPGGITEPHFSWGYKYEHLALQVWRVLILSQ